MDDAMMPHQCQGHEHLSSESTNECGREPGETVSLDQFIKIHTQELHRNA
jgi:hypothetical protein